MCGHQLTLGRSAVRPSEFQSTGLVGYTIRGDLILVWPPGGGGRHSGATVDPHGAAPSTTGKRGKVARMACPQETPSTTGKQASNRGGRRRQLSTQETATVSRSPGINGRGGRTKTLPPMTVAAKRPAPRALLDWRQTCGCTEFSLQRDLETLSD